MGIEDLKRYLAGTWALTRRALDRRRGTRHDISGRAVFSPEDDGLHYRETVSWEANGGTFTGHRVYRFTFPVPGQAAVCFEDGQFFHTLDLTNGADRVGHDCPPDRYDGTYRVLDAARYEVSWRVKGPRKDLLLVTLYTRMALQPMAGQAQAQSPCTEAIDI